MFQIRPRCLPFMLPNPLCHLYIKINSACKILYSCNYHYTFILLCNNINNTPILMHCSFVIVFQVKCLNSVHVISLSQMFYFLLFHNITKFVIFILIYFNNKLSIAFFHLFINAFPCNFVHSNIIILSMCCLYSYQAFGP